MSTISSVAAPVPVKAPEASAPPKAPDPKVGGDSDDASEAPKVAAAPLPPGQGARIDQLA